MKPEKLQELATRAQRLWTRMMPTCPPPSIDRFKLLRQQGAFALLEAIDRTCDKWDNGEFTSVEDAHKYVSATCRNIALSTDRRQMVVTHA